MKYPTVMNNTLDQEPNSIYAAETEEQMRRFYESLNEKDARRYAGIEALKIGHGGRNYIAKVLGCSRHTVSRGAKEVADLPEKEVDTRIRKKGGGRKPYDETHKRIDECFLAVLENHTAGDPMKEGVLWTDLSLSEIVLALQEDHDIRVSTHVVRKLLKKHDYRYRKAKKNEP